MARKPDPELLRMQLYGPRKSGWADVLGDRPVPMKKEPKKRTTDIRLPATGPPDPRIDKARERVMHDPNDPAQMTERDRKYAIERDLKATKRKGR